MAYIGKQPTAVPLTSSDITDGIIQLADLSATGTKDATTFLRGDNTFAVAGGNNTPAFRVYRSSNQTMGNGYQKIQHNAEDYDTDNAFDSTTNYRFTVPSGEAGKYFFNAQHKLNSMPNGVRIGAAIYVNGSIVAHNVIAVGITEDNSSNVSALLNLSVGDYVEMYGFHNHTAGLTAPGNSNSVYFEGYKLIG